MLGVLIHSDYCFFSNYDPYGGIGVDNHLILDRVTLKHNEDQIGRSFGPIPEFRLRIWLFNTQTSDSDVIINDPEN